MITVKYKEKLCQLRLSKPFFLAYKKAVPQARVSITSGNELIVVQFGQLKFVSEEPTQAKKK